ncbi:hypothetical protein BC628DRAFT_930669 [Trametes gibbosa]|nr:hypothetical protein BC628DRAFT_930669 [Trametes gibbosa]
MADQSAAPTDPSVNAKQATSTHGNPYEVGGGGGVQTDPSAGEGTQVRAQEASLRQTRRCGSVLAARRSRAQLQRPGSTTLGRETTGRAWTGPWATTAGKSTKHTPAAARGISQYRLYYNGPPNIYSYTLDFENTANWRFYFKDASGDIYEVGTWINGFHHLKYNSDQPTIVAIRSFTF